MRSLLASDVAISLVTFARQRCAVVSTAQLSLLPAAKLVYFEPAPTPGNQRVTPLVKLSGS